MGAVGISPGAPPDEAPRHDALHLRLVDLRQAAPAEAAVRCFLSRDESERAARFHFDADRSRFVLTRGWLRVVLARALGAAPERLEFSYGARGKPALGGGFQDAPLSFNVSHSGDYALIGLAAGQAIGVDIERLRPMPDFESIATGYFSAAETRAILGHAEGDRLRAFFRCWTRKEAFMKVSGEGMGIALDGFSVALGTDDDSTISPADIPGRRSGAFTVRGLSLAGECEAAVSAEGTAAQALAWLDSVSI
jgi:4'-phosphopantetheinyl transferase